MCVSVKTSYVALHFKVNYIIKNYRRLNRNRVVLLNIGANIIREEMLMS